MWWDYFGKRGDMLRVFAWADSVESFQGSLLGRRRWEVMLVGWG